MIFERVAGQTVALCTRGRAPHGLDECHNYHSSDEARGLTSGRIAYLFSAQHIDAKEAAWMAEKVIEEKRTSAPRWVLAAVALTLGFVVGQARLSCLIDATTSLVCP